MRMALSLKDIHDTLNSLRMEGRNINELEGLLIHTDDLEELLQSIPEYHNGMSRDGIRLFGVKIIESLYAQKGIIFRIFKTDDKVYAPPPGLSGIIEIGDVQGTVLGSASFRENSMYGPGITQLPVATDKKKQEKKKKKRRHSNARKINLD